MSLALRPDHPLRYQGVIHISAPHPAVVFGPTAARLLAWIIRDTWHLTVVAIASVVFLGGCVLALRWGRRRLAETSQRRAIAAMAGKAPNDGLDPFTVYVTLMATFLSVNGMWIVFGAVMHLPPIVRLVACTVLESSGFAFMRAARRDIQAKRPGTRHVAIVWAIAMLSGGLSAGASHSALEAIIRACLPSLAVLLCHSWMLPLPTEVTLSQFEKGKRAWRYVKATRRRERATNPVTRWVAERLLNAESDRLTKRSLMTGDASRVLSAAERLATTEALAGLGIAPSTEPNTRGLAVSGGPMDIASWGTDTDSRPTEPHLSRNGLVALHDEPDEIRHSSHGHGKANGHLSIAVVPAPATQFDALTGNSSPLVETDSRTGWPGSAAGLADSSQSDQDPATVQPRTHHFGQTMRTRGSADSSSQPTDSADARWSQDTSRIARQIIAEWRAGNVHVTSRAFFAELRARRGAVANRHKSALYTWAVNSDGATPNSQDGPGSTDEGERIDVIEIDSAVK